jgi:hypothetical protein
MLKEVSMQENIYEIHDIDMAVIDNFGAEKCLNASFRADKPIYRGVPRTKRIRFHAAEIVRGMTFEWIFASLTLLVKEPGQARHASIGSFPTGSAFNLGRNVEIGSGSHKSSLFPWDNAGISSSVAGAPFEMGSDRLSLGQDDVRLKDGSVGRSSGREGSLVPSHLNSGPGTLGLSPRTFEKIGSHINDSFEFDGRDSMILRYKLLICTCSSRGGRHAREPSWDGT